MKFYLYGVLNTETNKLVSNITNPRHKYWENEKSARSAICNYRKCQYDKSKLKVVKIACEIEE